MPDLNERVQVLKKTPFFMRLENHLLYELAALMEDMTCAEGSVIVKEGDVIDRVSIIVTGFAEVTQYNQGRQAQVKNLGPGDTVGLGIEGFFSATGLRTATVTALSDVSLLSLPASSFDTFLKTHGLQTGNVEQTSELILKMELIKRTTLFADLRTEDLYLLSKEVGSVDIPADTFIFQQGQVGDNCYLIAGGIVEVIVQDEITQESRIVAYLETPMIFGETSLLTASPRNAAVKTKTACQLLVISKEQLQDILRRYASAAQNASQLILTRSRLAHARHVTTYHRETVDGEKIAILKNDQRRTYYRLSAVGWYVWQLLDGKHTLQELTDAVLEKFVSLSAEAVTQLVAELTAAGLIDIPLELVKHERLNKFWWLRRMKKIIWILPLLILILGVVTIWKIF